MNNRSKPTTSVEYKKPSFLSIVLKQPALPLLLGIGAYMLTHAYSTGLEGSKMREQVDTWKTQAAAQTEPLSIEVVAADAKRCEETMMLMAKRGLEIAIAGEPATMGKIAKACEGGKAQVTILKGGN
ncbi:hypothetical protein D3C84_651430 [compost metagenome]